MMCNRMLQYNIIACVIITHTRMICNICMHTLPSQSKQGTTMKEVASRALLPASWCFLLAYSLTLKMKVTCSCETSIDFQQTTWCYIPEDRILNWRTVRHNVFYVIYVVSNTQHTKTAWEVIQILFWFITCIYTGRAVYVMMFYLRD